MESEKWKPGIREQTPDQHTQIYTYGSTHMGIQHENVKTKKMTSYNNIKMNANRHIRTE